MGDERLNEDLVADSSVDRNALPCVALKVCGRTGSIPHQRSLGEIWVQALLRLVPGVMIELLKSKGRDRWIRCDLSRPDLSFLQALKFLLAEPESDFLDTVLAQTLVLINLLALHSLGVDCKVLACHDDLLVPLVELLLLDGLLFSYHVVTTHEDSLEEFAI